MEVVPSNVSSSTDPNPTAVEGDDAALFNTVFHDLWSHGWYITSGTKFGGHYLLYPRDPFHFHAVYVVLVKGPDEAVACTDWVAAARVANTARKALLFATVLTDTHGDPPPQSPSTAQTPSFALLPDAVDTHPSRAPCVTRSRPPVTYIAVRWKGRPE
eukprot:TRINITY_DN8411_c0_g1_i1.p1 TRINITY_DN8411_c0_g1~~TRINITY_DN8411_c0_g1_i1.p1  ORF type:complete len:158 (-),score=12.76 TRINITY_DN8411_c0_g1_i1:252-725(-)